MQREFNPEVQLERNEQAELATICNMPGYKHLHRILRAEVDKFVVNLINAEKPEDVLAKHGLAKSAAQFYEGVTAKINEEIIQYTAAIRAADKPVDVTEHVLDIGEVASQLEELPNLLGEGEI